jgi:four helix bundle suffix protein
MNDNDPLIPKHGGYRSLKSFQVAQLAYDLTVRFCNHYIDRRSRTHDQMVQAARSGVQNIAEGSQVSGTSKKMEIKLTSVARASLEELKLDYEDYLRQRSLPMWDRTDPRRDKLIAMRPQTEADVAEWARAVHSGAPNEQSGQDGQEESSTQALQSTSSTKRPTYPEILANAALALLAVSCALLDRQLAAQGSAFEQEGGFTERLYHRRKRTRSEN